MSCVPCCRLSQSRFRHVHLPKFGNLQSADIGIKTGPYDLVTVADKDVESWLAPRLQDLQAGHCIGEEAVAETPELRQFAADGYAWSIDPIDGTNNFVNGVADFCSMVALMWNGVPLQCWIWLLIKHCITRRLGLVLLLSRYSHDSIADKQTAG